MTESIHLGETKLKAGMALTTPAKATPAKASVYQAPATSVNRQNDSVSGTSLPESKAEQIESTVTNLNDYVQRVHRNIHFSTHEETGRTVITVTDGETGEEIRKIPSEELLAIATHLAEAIEQLQQEPESGLLIDSYI